MVSYHPHYYQEEQPESGALQVQESLMAGHPKRISAGSGPREAWCP